jgi:hypothetical protein
LDGVVKCWKLIGYCKDLPLTTVGTEERDVRGEEAALLLLQYSESVSSQLLIRLPFSIRK